MSIQPYIEQRKQELREYERLVAEFRNGMMEKEYKDFTTKLYKNRREAFLLRKSRRKARKTNKEATSIVEVKVDRVAFFLLS